MALLLYYTIPDMWSVYASSRLDVTGVRHVVKGVIYALGRYVYHRGIERHAHIALIYITERIDPFSINKRKSSWF